MTTTPAPPLTDEDRALMRRAGEALARRRLAVPAMMFLETVAPLNFVGSTALHVLGPMVKSLLPPLQLERLARLLERREAIPEMIRTLDLCEEEFRRARETRDDDDAAPRAPSPDTAADPTEETRR